MAAAIDMLVRALQGCDVCACGPPEMRLSMCLRAAR
jgi:hypothetical protein